MPSATSRALAVRNVSFATKDRGDKPFVCPGCSNLNSRSRIPLNVFHLRNRSGWFARAYARAVVLCMMPLIPVRAIAQEVTAAFTGEVTDPSGAAIAGARVTATDLERGSIWPTVTNENGVYSLPRVPVGIYDVKVEHPGFQTAIETHVSLELNQTARRDFHLQVGSVEQSTQVTSMAPMLQTESTQLGQVIDARTNTELPLATRNYVQLTLLAPGSINPNPATFKSGLTTAGSGRPNVNGNREQGNNFVLDGQSNNLFQNNTVGYAPSVEAIQEFNEITSNAPAEFGSFMGGIISVTIKSGGNQFHGGAYEFFRNNVLNASDWASNWNGAPRAAVRWNNFGGTLGGPIKTNKLFFFADYQGSRDDTPTTINTITVLTMAERNGDFSQLLTQATPIQLYNPFSANAVGVRTPFADDMIPPSLISLAARNILSSPYYPQPTRNGLLNNLLYSSRTSIDGDQGDIKADYNVSDSDHIFGRYSQSAYNNPTFRSFALLYNNLSYYPAQVGVVDWTHTISPSLVNDARGGVNYVAQSIGSAADGFTDFPQQAGIPGVPSSFLPLMTFGGGNVSAFGSNAVLNHGADTVIQAGDTLIWSKERHNVRFGFQAYRYRQNVFYSGNNGEAGSFAFTGQYTAGPEAGTKAGTVNPGTGVASGIAEADFLLGLPSTIAGGVNGGTWGQRNNLFAAFSQDDWRIAPNLTLNAGLRWELVTPLDEVRNRQANFNLITGEEYISGQSCPYSNCNALYNQYDGITNFQPRVGAAWTPGDGRMVIRAAYTLSSFLEGTGVNLRLPLNPPFGVEHLAQYTTAQYNVLPGSTLDQGFLPFISDPGDQYHSVTLRVWDPNVRPAVSNQWNFTMQYQVSPGTSFSVGYVGSRTTHLMVAMPYFQKVLNPDGTVSPTRYLSGDPSLLADIGGISGTASVGNQDYEGLQILMQRRFSGGLQYSVAYTYSKCMTDSIGYFGQAGQAAGPSPFFQNIYDAAADWGPCEYDATHNLVANALYNLPFGRERAAGSHLNKAAEAIAGGWQAGAILSLHTGFPVTVTANDASGTLAGAPRANCLFPATVYGEQNAPQGGYLWFNPSAYAQPATGTFGNCGNGTLRGPGLASLDFNLQKSFRIRDRQSVDLRGEFFNLTNTPILNGPSHGIGPTLGLLQSSQGARNVQIALRYRF